MQITFLGAAREVTGSCSLVETEKTRIMIDCGMFQGCNLCDIKNYMKFPVDASTIDAVVLTHAHLDHIGRIPKLVKEGFRGKIYATPPTLKLAKIVLDDAYHIMQEDERREGRPMLYDDSDIDRVFEYAVPLDYSRYVDIEDIKFRLRDAGHIFGSSFVEIWEQGGASIGFSGDVGNDGAHILRPTAQLADLDALVIESTYGNRIHEDEGQRWLKLKAVVERTARKQAVLVIPAFAIERTQQILYELNELVESGQLPPIDTYLDSPMAIRATKVMKEYPQYYDQEAFSRIARGDDFFEFPGLTLTETRDESKAINDARRPKIIIAGSGMMTGGRILHHLLRYLSHKDNTILIIGYQAQGTLGRKIYRGDKVVNIMGERVQVKAHIESIGAYSAHADQAKLIRWVHEAAGKPERIFCNHGDEGAAVALATQMKKQLGIEASAPKYLETVTL